MRIGNGAWIIVKGKWTIAIIFLKLIYDVLYVLEINQNMFSVTQLLEKGYKKCYLKGKKNMWLKMQQIKKC